MYKNETTKTNKQNKGLSIRGGQVTNNLGRYVK